MESCTAQNANIYCPGNTSKPDGWSEQETFSGCISPKGWNDPAVKWNQNQPRH
jgi:hypothetical protein